MRKEPLKTMSSKETEKGRGYRGRESRFGALGYRRRLLLRRFQKKAGRKLVAARNLVGKTGEPLHLNERKGGWLRRKVCRDSRRVYLALGIEKKKKIKRSRKPRISLGSSSSSWANRIWGEYR